MEPAATDFELLRTFAETRSDEAFGRLVARHANFVHGVARRRIADANLAEDITQAVFVILARRAHTLNPEVSLVAWLHQTTRYAASNALRSESRRKRRERTFAQTKPVAANESAFMNDLTIQLEDALAGLRRSDREILSLHYLEDRSVEQTASFLSISTHAANKRISRALQRIRDALQQRAVVVDSSAVTAGLAALRLETLQPAPISILLPDATGRVFTIATEVTRMMQLMTLARVAAVTLLLAMVGTITVLAATPDKASVADSKPTESPGKPLSIKFNNGATFELVGITTGLRQGTGSWWAPDGTPIDPPTDRRDSYGGDDDIFTLFGRATFAADDNPGLFRVIGSRVAIWGGGGTPETGYTWSLRPVPSFTLTDISVGIAVGPWRVLHTLDKDGKEKRAMSSDRAFHDNGTVMWTAISQLNNAPMVSVFDDLASTLQVRLVAFDVDGKEYQPSPSRNGSTGLNYDKLRATYGYFKGLPPEKLSRLEFQGRPYEFARLHDISLRPNQKTPARIAPGALEDQPLLERRLYGTEQWSDPFSGVMQFIAFTTKAEVDVRWEQLAIIGITRQTMVVVNIDNPTVAEAFEQVKKAIRADRLKVEYVEDKALNVKKIVVTAKGE